MPNGVRYPSRSMGGTRQCRSDGTNFKPRKVLENAPAKRPTTMAPAHFAGDRLHVA